MTDLPIIFSAPMVRALLDGRKTQTRRLAWREHKPDADGYLRKVSLESLRSPWQRVKPGDRLWVRENIGQRKASFFGIEASNGVREAAYAADGDDVVDEHEFNLCPWWKGEGTLPCIHMPRWASRLTLIVTATKIERVQDIGEADAIAEGWQRHPEFSDDPEVHRDAARDWYSDLWDSLHGVESWRANPEVVALTFAIQKSNIDALPKDAAA